MATRTFTYKINMDLAGVKTGSKTMQVTLASMQGDAAKTDASMQKLADAIGKRYGVQTKIARDETRSFQNAIKQAAREANRAEKSYEQITKEFKQLQASIGMTTDELQVFNAQQRLGANATEQQKKQIADLVMGYQGMRNAANQTQGSMRGLRGQAQNVGWQLQDVAVQAQMGTNALTILGQQGSQFASGFGPMGALIGAGIAVGAVALSVLIPSLLGADHAMKELEKTSKDLELTFKRTADGSYELTDAIGEMAKRSKELAQANIANSIIDAEKKIKQASQGIRVALIDSTAISMKTFSDEVYRTGMSLDEVAKSMKLGSNAPKLNDTIGILGRRLGITRLEAVNFGIAMSDLQKETTPLNIKKFEAELGALNKTYNFSNKKLQELTKEFSPFFLAVLDGVDQLNDGKIALNNFNDALSNLGSDENNLLSQLREQMDLLAATELQQNLYTINRSKMSDADKEAARQIAINLAYQKDLIDTLEEGAETEKKNAAEKAKLAQANEDLVESLRQQVDVINYTATQNINYQRGLQLLTLTTQGATQEQINAANAYYDTLVTASELSEETEEYTQFLKELTKAEEDNVKAVEKQADAYDVFLQKLNDAEAQLEKNRENLLAKRSDSGKIAQLKKQYEEEMKLAQGNAEAMGNIEEYYARERIKVNGDVWEKLAVQSMEALEDTDEMMLQSMDRLVSGFGTAMAQMVTGSKKPGEALKDMFAGAIGSMVQFFAEWAAQKLILWALDKTLNAGTAASHATAMGANTGAKVAEAGLNAYAATAAIPIVGPALAPAAAGMAIAATSPMAATATTLASIGIGAFDRGGLIPAGGAGIVSEIGDELVGGTMVYNGSQNSLGVTGREDTARMRGGNGPVSITVNSSGNASPEAISRALVRALKRKSKGLDTGLYDAMNRGRTNRGKRFNA